MSIRTPLSSSPHNVFSLPPVLCPSFLLTPSFVFHDLYVPIHAIKECCRSESNDTHKYAPSAKLRPFVRTQPLVPYCRFDTPMTTTENKPSLILYYCLFVRPAGVLSSRARAQAAVFFSFLLTSCRICSLCRAKSVAQPTLERAHAQLLFESLHTFKLAFLQRGEGE